MTVGGMDRLTDRALMKLNFCGRCDSVDAGRSDAGLDKHVIKARRSVFASCWHVVDRFSKWIFNSKC